MTLLIIWLRYVPSQAIRITAQIVKCELIPVKFTVQDPGLLRRTLTAISLLTSSIYTPPGRLVTRLKFPEWGPIPLRWKLAYNFLAIGWQRAWEQARPSHPALTIRKL